MSQTADNQDFKKQNSIRFNSLLDKLKTRFPDNFQQQAESSFLLVSIAEQQLYIFKQSKIIKRYTISSAEKGIGYISGSLQTPLGLHQISEKYGENAAFASIFKARKNTGKIASILESTETRSPNDNITSRILCLDGLEEGINKGFDSNGKCVDTHSRYIYIHGTDEEGHLGQPASHGCIRMANEDVIDLFEDVDNGNLVFISEK